MTCSPRTSGCCSRRLSVFAGGWTLEAAEAVGAGDGIQEADVLELLSMLVDKSLVVAEKNGEGAGRYRMLEPIRQYARERLEESGEAESLKAPARRVLPGPGRGGRAGADGSRPASSGRSASKPSTTT